MLRHLLPHWIHFSAAKNYFLNFKTFPCQTVAIIACNLLFSIVQKCLTVPTMYFRDVEITTHTGVQDAIWVSCSFSEMIFFLEIGGHMSFL